MKLTTVLAAIVPLAFASAVYADGEAASSGSLYQHQTNAGKFEVTPMFDFASIKTNYSATYSDGSPAYTSSTDSVFGFNVNGEYGINDMFSVGIRLGYESDDITFSPSQGKNGDFKASGMTDPAIYLNGRYMMGPGSLRFGGNFSFATSNFTLSSGGKGNEATGGMTLTPYVGYEMMMGPGLGGLRIAYDVLQTNRKGTDNAVTPSQSFTTNGGNNLSAIVFYEMNFQPLIWGLDAGVVNHSASTNAPANVASTSNHDAFTNFKVETYGSYEVAADINILLNVGYGTVGNASQLNSAGVTGVGGIYGILGARFGF